MAKPLGMAELKEMSKQSDEDSAPLMANSHHSSERHFEDEFDDEKNSSYSGVESANENGISIAIGDRYTILH